MWASNNRHVTTTVAKFHNSYIPLIYPIVGYCPSSNVDSLNNTNLTYGIGINYLNPLKGRFQWGIIGEAVVLGWETPKKDPRLSKENPVTGYFKPGVSFRYYLTNRFAISGTVGAPIVKPAHTSTQFVGFMPSIGFSYSLKH
jgi:hypothetical protein